MAANEAKGGGKSLTFSTKYCFLSVSGAREGERPLQHAAGRGHHHAGGHPLRLLRPRPHPAQPDPLPPHEG